MVLHLWKLGSQQESIDNQLLWTLIVILLMIQYWRNLYDKVGLETRLMLILVGKQGLELATDLVRISHRPHLETRRYWNNIFNTKYYKNCQPRASRPCAWFILSLPLSLILPTLLLAFWIFATKPPGPL